MPCLDDPHCCVNTCRMQAFAEIDSEVFGASGELGVRPAGRLNGKKGRCVGIPVDRDHPFRFIVTGDSGLS